jgi:hypothetical protein
VRLHQRLRNRLALAGLGTKYVQEALNWTEE